MPGAELRGRAPCNMSENLVRTMSGQITARIREKILTGVYPPGSALLQDVIAAEFGVSKIPVREALVQLRAEGLVDVFAHRGFQVRPLSSSEVDEVFRLRAQIEPEAVAEGVRRAQPEDIDAARLAFGNLNDALAAGELYESGDLNRTFHLALIVPRCQQSIGVIFVGHDVQQDLDAPGRRVQLQALVQLRVQLLLMAAQDLRGGFHERVKRRRVERLGVLLVAAHRPGADQGGLGVAVAGHLDGPAVVFLVLDDAGGPAVVAPEAVFVNDSVRCVEIGFSHSS